jgi:hypothetical protein
MKATSPTVTVFGSLPAAILSTTMPLVMIPRNWPSSPHTASAATPSSRIRWPAHRRVFPLPATSACAVSTALVTATSAGPTDPDSRAGSPPAGPAPHGCARPSERHRAKGPLSASTKLRRLQTAARSEFDDDGPQRRHAGREQSADDPPPFPHPPLLDGTVKTDHGAAPWLILTATRVRWMNACGR